MSNIVVLDLEWDSAYFVAHHRFVNQIVQIGAIRLDERLNITDSFCETVRSSLTKKLTGRFTTLTGITSREMLAGIPLSEAFRRYNRWVGENPITYTYSTSDLYTILENESLLLDSTLSLKIGKYVDLQSYVQSRMREAGFEISSQISLEKAAEMLDIQHDRLNLHMAKDDCILSAALLRRFYSEESVRPFIKDTANPEFYRRLTFKSYHLSNLKDDRIKPKDLQFCCDKCGLPAKCITKWKYRNGWFSANFRCPECKRMFIGRVSFKQTYDDLLVKRRIVDVKAVEKRKAEGEKLKAVEKKNGSSVQ